MMIVRPLLSTLFLVAILFTLSACGGGGTTSQTSSSSQSSTTVVQAHISSVSPASTPAGSAGTTITVTGQQFTSSTQVLWNGAALQTTFVSATQLTAVVPATALTQMASVQVTVSGSDGSTAAFAVGPPLPALASIIPTTAIAGTPVLSLSVNGANFPSDSQVSVNGVPATRTTVTNSTTITAQIPGVAIGHVQKYSVTVQSASAGSSNAATFTSTASGTAAAKLVAIPTQYVSDDLQYSLSITGGSINAAGTATIQTTCATATSPCTPTPVGSTLNPGALDQFGTFSPSMSGNGRYVAYVQAPAYVVGGPQGPDLAMVFDSCNGQPSTCDSNTLVLASADNSGNPIASTDNLHNIGPQISDSGRFVSFFDITNNYIDVRDTCIGASGCSPAILFQVTDDQLLVGPGPYVLSQDARYLTYQAQPSDYNSVVVKQADTCIGAPASPSCSPGTHVVSLLADGSTAAPSGLKHVSANGRYVSFYYGGNIYLRDTCNGATGACAASTTLAATTLSTSPALLTDLQTSDDGRYWAFSSSDSSLDTNLVGKIAVYIVDTQSCLGQPSGCSLAIQRLTIGVDGAAFDSDAYPIWVSNDGKWVIVGSMADNVVATTGTVSDRGTYLIRTKF